MLNLEMFQTAFRSHCNPQGIITCDKTQQARKLNQRYFNEERAVENRSGLFSFEGEIFGEFFN